MSKIYLSNCFNLNLTLSVFNKHLRLVYYPPTTGDHMKTTNFVCSATFSLKARQGI